MTAKDNRVCVDCKFFRFYPGCTGYSECTPGWDATLECSKGIWKYDPHRTTEDEFRANMKKAATCDKFVHRQT